MFTPLIRWIKAHDLLAFSLLTFVISWGVWIPVILSTPHRDVQNFTGVNLGLIYIGLWGPALSGALITAVTHGKPGLKEMFQRLLFWRVPARWYMVILLGVPAITILAALLQALITRQPPSIHWSNWPIILSLPLSGLLIGFNGDEEIGWRGFALPRLLRRWNALFSSLVLGILWGCWHLPEFIWQIKGFSMPIPFSFFLVSTVSLSILMTWLYNHTQGSLFVSLFFHFWINAYTNYQYALFTPVNPGGMIIVRDTFVAAAAILIVILYGYRNLNRSRKSPVPDGLKTSEV